MSRFVGDSSIGYRPDVTGAPDVPDITIVCPAYNEEANLDAFYNETTAVLTSLGVSYSMLFVNDGSRDRTPEILARLHARDSRVEYLNLARNFGLQGALTAGLAHAPGRAIVIMDADLQDDPQALGMLIDRWREGYDVAYAVRLKRKENAIKRACYNAFYWGLAKLADVPIPRDSGPFALYDRKVVDQINALPERNRFLPGLRAWVGFKQIAVPIERRARNAGEPALGFWRLVSLAADGVFSFSKAPLRLATMVGFGVTCLSAVSLLIVVYWRFIAHSIPEGFGLATIALALLFLGGVQLVVLGVIGEYLGRVYDEVKRRPNFIVATKNGEPVGTAQAPVDDYAGGMIASR